MGLLSLSFESGEESLSVRRFSVQEGLSSLFNIHIWAQSPNDDLDFEALIGKRASFIMRGAPSQARPSGERKWSGICQTVELTQAESTGLSSYYLRIVPQLWFLTQRTNHKLFQHLSVPDIVDKLLQEFEIKPTWRADRGQYPKLNLRTQYGETDFAFMSRLLEEAGISYFHEDGDDGTSLVLTDAPHAATARAGGSIDYAESPNFAAESDLTKLLDGAMGQLKEHVTGVRFARHVRPGKVTLRDFDFRRKPDFKLLGQGGGSKGGVEDKLEVYQYSPGSFLVEMPEGGAKQMDASIGLNVGAKLLSDAAAQGGSGGESGGGGGAAGAIGAVAGMVAQAAGNIVDKAVTDAVAKSVGGLVGDFLGQLAGDLAGNMASKLAGAIASPAAGSANQKMSSDDKAFARYDPKHGEARANKQLEAMRSTRFSIDFATNAIDMAPGSVFSMSKHPKKELGSDKRLLVTESQFDGTVNGEWSLTCHAAMADEPVRPLQKTHKPQIQGVQSATIVGPPGEEIHTDEFGRVRVQFPWDREGQMDDNSSCWIRVAQGTAGPGFGMVQLPRVGQEVLVSYLEGDPDQPMVVGTVFSNTTPVPHALPGHKTRMSWRSNSYPGGGGANEIMMEDQKGSELFYLLAQKNMQSVVKSDKGTIVGSTDSTLVGQKYEVKVAQAAGTPPDTQTQVVMLDKNIKLTTGDASITLEKDKITLWAKNGINLTSEKGDVQTLAKAGDVKIKGGPNVKINPKPKECKKAGSHGTKNGKRYVVYDDQVKSGGSRAWRNNNPGNLDYGSFAKNHGAIGSDGRAAIFPDEATGAQAMKDLLQGPNYSGLTIKDAINKYAPPSENDTDAYVATIKNEGGLDPDATVGTLSDSQFDSMVNVMRKVEGWKPGDTYKSNDPNAPQEYKEMPCK